jgi:hypothetical protein
MYAFVFEHVEDKIGEIFRGYLIALWYLMACKSCIRNLMNTSTTMIFKYLTYITLTMHNKVSNTYTILIRLECCEVYTRQVVDMTLLTLVVVWELYLPRDPTTSIRG